MPAYLLTPQKNSNAIILGNVFRDTTAYTFFILPPGGKCFGHHEFECELSGKCFYSTVAEIYFDSFSSSKRFLAPQHTYIFILPFGIKRCATNHNIYVFRLFLWWKTLSDITPVFYFDYPLLWQILSSHDNRDSY